jgi:S-adenosylmethionine decarboxylase
LTNTALFPLGIDLDSPGKTQEEDIIDAPAAAETEQAQDHLIVKHGVKCAGSHLIIDVYGGDRLDDLAHVERTLIDCVEAAGATLLHIHLHPFEENGGISGVAVLAESHISIHSWPEHGYAALDVFMCGDAEPERCVDVLREAFAPERVAVSEILRGKAL